MIEMFKKKFFALLCFNLRTCILLTQLLLGQKSISIQSPNEPIDLDDADRGDGKIV